MPLKILLAMAETVGRLRPVRVFVPEVALPVKAISSPVVETVPAPELLVKFKETNLSVLVEVVRVSEIFPEERVRFPAVIVSFPLVSVRFFPEAMVVSPFKEMAPVPVPNVPAPEIAKLPED